MRLVGDIGTFGDHLDSVGREFLLDHSIIPDKSSIENLVNALNSDMEATYEKHEGLLKLDQI